MHELAHLRLLGYIRRVLISLQRGQPACYCGVGLNNPLFREHTKECKEAFELIALINDKLGASVKRKVHRNETATTLPPNCS